MFSAFVEGCRGAESVKGETWSAENEEVSVADRVLASVDE